jgi:hypothetical protein
MAGTQQFLHHKYNKLRHREWGLGYSNSSESIGHRCRGLPLELQGQSNTLCRELWRRSSHLIASTGSEEPLLIAIVERMLEAIVVAWRFVKGPAIVAIAGKLAITVAVESATAIGRFAEEPVIGAATTSRVVFAIATELVGIAFEW